MPPRNPISRRDVLAAAGLAAANASLAAPARAQRDSFQVIRAQAGGYDGKEPGPVLRVRRGAELRVRLVNELPVETAVHWHGVRVPNAMDGTSLTQKPIAPGASFDYRFTPPDAGTFWFHPPIRAAQNRALHGLLIVQETSPPRVDDETAIVIGVVNDKLAANGSPSLDIAVWPKSRVRLRLANATDDLVAIRVADHPMHVVAIDGQPAEPFLSRESRITLSPGNRADVLIDAVMKPSSVAPVLARMGDAEVPLARLLYGNGIVQPGASMPDGYAGDPVKPLEPNPLPERMDFRNAVRVDLALDAAASGLSAKPLFSAKRGRTVMLALANKGAAPVITHIHGHAVRLLDRLDDGWKPFWLDTILCVPQQTTRVAFVADNPGKWLIQSRVIGAEATSLNWFEVT